MTSISVRAKNATSIDTVIDSCGRAGETSTSPVGIQGEKNDHDHSVLCSGIVSVSNTDRAILAPIQVPGIKDIIKGFSML